jgi:hypothetical protein
MAAEEARKDYVVGFLFRLSLLGHCISDRKSIRIGLFVLACGQAGGHCPICGGSVPNGLAHLRVPCLVVIFFPLLMAAGRA